MSEKAGTMLDFMRGQLKETSEGGGNFNVFFTKPNAPKKIRMLCEIEDAFKIRWHEKKENNGKDTVYDHPCLVHYGRECPTCELEDRKTPLFQFGLTVYEYEFDKKRLFLYKYNKCSPLPFFGKRCERNGTIMDRDFIIEQEGKGIDRTFDVEAQDKEDFGKDLSMLTQEEILEIIKNDRFRFQLPEGVNFTDLKDLEDLPF